MAIEDHPVLANHDHAQQLEQRIKSAASEYQSAIKKVAAERKALKHWQEDWIEAREEHVKRLNHLNSFIEHYVQKLDMIIPSSVWPSLIINDPKAPAYDDETANDYKQTIMDSHSYDEVAELIQDQEALRDLRQKREIAINIHKINSKKLPRENCSTGTKSSGKKLKKHWNKQGAFG